MSLDYGGPCLNPECIVISVGASNCPTCSCGWEWGKIKIDNKLESFKLKRDIRASDYGDSMEDRENSPMVGEAFKAGAEWGSKQREEEVRVLREALRAIGVACKMKRGELIKEGILKIITEALKEGSK